jgi:hypothetical protein
MLRAAKRTSSLRSIGCAALQGNQPQGGELIVPVVSDYTALLSGNNWNGADTTSHGRSVILTYSFSAVAQPYLSLSGFSQTFIDSFQPFSAAEITAAHNAFAQWGVASGIQFVEVPAGLGTIQLGNFELDYLQPNATGFAYLPAISMPSTGNVVEDPIFGDVFFDLTNINADNINNVNTYLALHEIGHALGLKHPFDASPTLNPALDNRTQTVMSYTGVWTDQLGPLDVQAIQYLYGSNASDNSHVSSWSWNPATLVLTQIGLSGNDQLFGEYGKDYIDGGSGNDVLAGFESDDTLVGGPGNDLLIGGSGSDAIIGGVGVDTAAFEGPSTQYNITHSGLGFVVTDSVASRDGTDTLIDVEFAQFTDKTISLLSGTKIDGTIPAVAVEASMYGFTGTSVEITNLTANFLPAQIANATSHGFNPQVYACEALGLVFAFGNETGSTAFANNFGPSNNAMPNTAAGDAAFAAAACNTIVGAASTANLVSVMQTWVSNWEAFYTAHGIPGNATPTAAQIDLAARGAAWGDMVGVALANNIGPLSGQVVNFLEDAAQGTVLYGASLVGQPIHQPFA